VAIPTEAARDVMTGLVSKSRDGILDGTGEDVAVLRRKNKEISASILGQEQ